MNGGVEQIFLVILLVAAAAGYLMVYYRRLGRGRGGCRCDLYKNFPEQVHRDCRSTCRGQLPKTVGPSTDKAACSKTPSEPPDPSA